MRRLFHKARLICPAQALDSKGWLVIDDGLIAETGIDTPPDALLASADEVIDCTGLILGPGLVDMRAETRDPGAEHLETLDTLLAAAAAGGITSLAIQPQTDPVIDNAALIDSLQLRASRRQGPHLYCHGAMSRNLDGTQMAELGMMAASGAVGFSNGHSSIQDTQTMRRILTYAAMLDKPVMHHCEDISLSDGSDMNEGATSTRLGLIGSPIEAETIILERDLQLVRLTGARYHAAHLTTAKSVEAVRRAKNEGLPVTADTSAPYFQLNELAVSTYSSAAKLNPPLRTEDDRQAIMAALADGTIDVIASDHVPVNPDMKHLPFSLASCGASGLEVMLVMTLRLVLNDVISWQRAFELLSLAPATILDIPGGSLVVGTEADIALIDPRTSWIVTGREFNSLSRITPFEGQPVEGRAVRTIVGGADIFIR